MGCCVFVGCGSVVVGCDSFVISFLLWKTKSKAPWWIPDRPLRASFRSSKTNCSLRPEQALPRTLLYSLRTFRVGFSTSLPFYPYGGGCAHSELEASFGRLVGAMAARSLSHSRSQWYAVEVPFMDCGSWRDWLFGSVSKASYARNNILPTAHPARHPQPGKYSGTPFGRAPGRKLPITH